jgi:hypothetical protein
MWETDYEQVPRRPSGRGAADVVLTVTDSDGLKVYVLNPREIFDFRPYGRGWGGGGRGGLYVLWFDQHAPTRVGVFAASLESALEESAGFLKDHWPGMLVDDDHLKELYKEALAELVAEGADPEDDDTVGKAQENATADMTYTESGYIGSDDWGIWCDDVEGNPCIQELEDSIAVAAAGEILGADDTGIEDVADVVRHLRDTPLWGRGVGKAVPVWGEETAAVKALLAGTTHGEMPSWDATDHGELISWDTTDKNSWAHVYLLYRPKADMSHRRVVVVEHDELFPEE